jgi:hypothetical protein
MDEKDAGRSWRRPSPIEEVETVARFDQDDETVRLGEGVRRRQGLHRP